MLFRSVGVEVIVGVSVDEDVVVGVSVDENMGCRPMSLLVSITASLPVSLPV